MMKTLNILLQQTILILFTMTYTNAAFNGDYTFQLESATQAEIDAVGSAQVGMMVYNTTSNEINSYNGTTWVVSDGNETVTSISQDISTGVITYVNEANVSQPVNVVSKDNKNKVVAGGDGGAYVGPSIHIGFFTISIAGSQVITGIPFQPSQITFVAHANVENVNLDNDNGIGNNVRGIGNSFGTMNGFVRDDNGSIVQQVIYVGSHGNSVNDISRFASSANCIGVRYGNQNGDDLGKITASLSSFDTNGFTIEIVYNNGLLTVNSGNSVLNVQPDDVLNEGLVVLYTAYK